MHAKSGLVCATALLGLSLSTIRADALVRLDPEYQIERIAAEVFDTVEGWKLQIFYQVELEDVPAVQGYEMVFIVKEDRRTLRDPKGHPIRVAVPLEQPSEVDDEEMKFRDTFVIGIPDGSFGHPGRLHIMSRLVRAADRRILARDLRPVQFAVLGDEEGFGGVEVEVEVRP